MASASFRIGYMNHPSEIDEYWDNVVLLCLFDTEPNLSTTIIDATGRHTLASGFAGAEVRHSESVFDNVGAFQTNGLQCLTGSLYSDDSADWHFGTGDFTIEMHIYAAEQVPTSGNSFAYISQQASDADPGWLCYYHNNGGTPELRFLAFPSGGSPNIFSNAFTFSNDTWYHVAWVRSGNTLYQFVEGDLLGTGHAFSLTLPDVDKSLEIGGAYDSNLNDFGGSDGRIDNIRITKGIARYTSSFTPPTGPYPVR